MSSSTVVNRLRQMHPTAKPVTSGIANRGREVRSDGWTADGPTAKTALRDGTVTGTQATLPGQQRSARGCVVCGAQATGRGQYCSPACRQQAYRLRQQPDQRTLLKAITVDLTHQQALVAHMVYRCSNCDQRLLGEWRCPDCGLMCKKLGLGGPCPHCDQLVVLVELLEGELS